MGSTGCTRQTGCRRGCPGLTEFIHMLFWDLTRVFINNEDPCYDSFEILGSVSIHLSISPSLPRFFFFSFLSFLPLFLLICFCMHIYSINKCSSCAPGTDLQLKSLVFGVPLLLFSILLGQLVYLHLIIIYLIKLCTHSFTKKQLFRVFFSFMCLFVYLHLHL